MLTKKNFCQVVSRFMQRASLYPASGRAFLALSGGMDSMALLFCLKALLDQRSLRELILLHVNHGTRKENQEEEEFVRHWANQFQLEIRIKKLHWPLSQLPPNFEHLARKKRYEFFQSQILEEGDKIYTAHHIDDSFEWSLLQGLRSGQLKSSLGIPVSNGFLARPFHCVTRRQIARFIQLANIPFRHDPSNDSLQFERNYLRQEIIPLLKRRYPAYLKNYVSRSNQLAMQLGASIFQKNEKSSPSSFKSFNPFLNNKENHILLFEDRGGGVGLFHREGKKEFTSQERMIRQILENLSSKERGVVRDQIQKLILASSHGKIGPLLFSGGVYGYICRGILYFLPDKKRRVFEEADELLYQQLKNFPQSINSGMDSSQLSKSLKKKFLKKLKWKNSLKETGHQIQIFNNQNQNQKQEGLTDPLALFPYWIISGEGGGKNSDQQDLERILASTKSIHPLWPKSTTFLIEKKRWFRPITDILWELEKVEKKQRGLNGKK